MSNSYGWFPETLRTSFSLIFLLLFGEFNRGAFKLWLIVGVQDHSWQQTWALEKGRTQEGRWHGVTYHFHRRNIGPGILVQEESVLQSNTLTFKMAVDALSQEGSLHAFRIHLKAGIPVNSYSDRHLSSTRKVYWGDCWGFIYTVKNTQINFNLYQTTYMYLFLAGNLRQMSLGQLSFQAIQYIHLDAGEV